MKLQALAFALFLPLSTLATPVAAAPDVLMDGTKGLDHVHRLVGLDSAPDYRFLHAPVHLDGWAFLEEGQAFSWYKLHGTKIYAVKNGIEVPTEYDPAWLAELPQTRDELFGESAVRENSPAASRETVYRVTAVEDGEIKLALVEDHYEDESGAVVDPESFISLLGGGPASGLIMLSAMAVCGLMLVFFAKRIRG